MSFVYGGYNPKAAPSGAAAGANQDASTSATGRKFAVIGGLGKLGGLGYSKPPPKPAAASQVPVAPAAASPTPSTAAAASSSTPPPPATSPPQEQPQPSVTIQTTVPVRTTVIMREVPGGGGAHQVQQQTVVVEREVKQEVPPHLQPVHQVRLQPQARVAPQLQQQSQQGYGASRAAVVRPVMPVMRTGIGLGYAAQVRPVIRSNPGYAAGSSLGDGGGGLSLNVPLREPTPEPVPVVVMNPALVKPEYSIEDDYKVYGTVDDVDIQIRNVVCNYTLPLHIDLRRLAQNSNNVTFDRGRGVLLKQKRNPNCYVKIYSSGKVYIVGCRSEMECMTAARTIARNVQRAMNKLNTEVRIRNYRVCNVLATCKMPFGVKIEEVATAHPSESQYEPELSVGLVWRNKEPKATLRIHTTGSVTVTGAQSEADVYTVIARLYPILLKYKCPPRAKGELTEAAKRKKEATAAARKRNLQFNSYGGQPRSKMSRGESGVIGGRVVFSDEEDEDDMYDADLYDDEE